MATLDSSNYYMQNENSPVSRKKFVFWSVGVLSVFTAARYFFSPGRKKNTTTVKMLAQDGKLVEVDISKLPSKRKKIKDFEIHSWVHRKPSL